MTVGCLDSQEGVLARVIEEREDNVGEHEVILASRSGMISPALRIGARVASAVTLLGNSNISWNGMMLRGNGFLLDPSDKEMLARSLPDQELAFVKPYLGGKDFIQRSRDLSIIDFDELDLPNISESAPALLQMVIDRVKPERVASRDKRFRDHWWKFGRTRPAFRQAVAELDTYVVTVETAKHRCFARVDSSVVPDHMLVCIAVSDEFFLGVLASTIHQIWSLALGGRLEDRPRYNKTRCFETFPFPDPDEATRKRIRALGEQLDAHRKRQQALHPGLTLTGMYNVLDKLRAMERGLQPASASDGESTLKRSEGRAPALTPKEKQIHEQGLVSVLKQIHDDLDAAVFAGYGWPATLTDEEILERLVALNHERAEEEKRGHIRWLRPDYQCRDQTKQPVQSEMVEAGDNQGGQPATPQSAIRNLKLAWPKTLSEQVEAVRRTLETATAPVTAAALAKQFQRANRERIAEILETLVALGKAREAGPGRFLG